MRLRHRGEPFDTGVGPRNTPPRMVIDVQHHHLAGCNGEPLLAVKHRMEKMHELAVPIDDLARDPYRLPFAQFALVVDMRLQHEEHPELAFGVCRGKPQLLEQHVGRLVECDHVVGHVHMSVSVDPFGNHARPIPFEGRREVELR